MLETSGRSDSKNPFLKFSLIFVGKKKTNTRELQFAAFNNDFSPASTYSNCWIPRMQNVRPHTTVASMLHINGMYCFIYIYIYMYISAKKYENRMIQVKDVIEYTWNQTVGFINILDMRKQKRVRRKKVRGDWNNCSTRFQGSNQYRKVGVGLVFLQMKQSLRSWSRGDSYPVERRLLPSWLD